MVLLRDENEGAVFSVLIASAHGAGGTRCRKNAAPPRKVTRTQLWTFDGPGFSRRAWIEETEENT
jgi:hypothetical protein